MLKPRKRTQVIRTYSRGIMVPGPHLGMNHLGYPEAKSLHGAPTILRRTLNFPKYELGKHILLCIGLSLTFELQVIL